MITIQFFVWERKPLGCLQKKDICVFAHPFFSFNQTQASPMAITLLIHISTETPLFESIQTIENLVFK